MAVFGLSWGISSTIGPWGAGVILDNYNPNWVWYLCGILAAVSVAGFLVLDARTRKRLVSEAVPRPSPNPQWPDGRCFAPRPHTKSPAGAEETGAIRRWATPTEGRRHVTQQNAR